MIDVAVDLVLVDALGEQLADDEKDLRTAGVVGETARIGHHAAIDGNGELLGEGGEGPHLPNEAEHEFAGAAGFGFGDDEVGRHIGVEMMVDEHAGSG